WAGLPPPAARAAGAPPALPARAQRAGRAGEHARAGREAAAVLARIQPPADVPGLAGGIARADALIADRKDRLAAAEAAEQEAMRAPAALPGQTTTQRHRHPQAQRGKPAAPPERHQAGAGRPPAA